MNTQTIIQKLIDGYLIMNAKMQAYEGSVDNLSMLITIATNEVPSNNVAFNVAYELRTNANLY